MGCFVVRTTFSLVVSNSYFSGESLSTSWDMDPFRNGQYGLFDGERQFSFSRLPSLGVVHAGRLALLPLLPGSVRQQRRPCVGKYEKIVVLSPK
uniref:Secreted protein n=1 Tax=Steinernema glaseri TaxID=37863 RepID=A0A1I7YX50_9BILA